MDEKKIIVGKPSYLARRLLLFIGVGLVLLALVMYGLNVGECRKYAHDYGQYTLSGTISIYDLMTFQAHTAGILVGIILDLGIIFVLFGFAIYLALAKVSVTVTDKRVYGTANWGKRVDLPLDSISAAAMGAFKGIAVATSSGKIRFKGIKNNIEVFEAISELLIKRQNKKTGISVASSKQEQTQSSADELKKFKELLDSGVITQEEFEAKKKQLLGL